MIIVSYLEINSGKALFKIDSKIKNKKKLHTIKDCKDVTLIHLTDTSPEWEMFLIKIKVKPRRKD